MVDLDRRKILVGIGAGLTGLVLKGCLSIGYGGEFAAQRQQLIDRIAQEEPLPNLGRALYDYDGGIGISLYEGYVKRALKEPRLEEYVLAAFSHADAFGKRASPEFIRELLDSPVKLENVLRDIWIDVAKAKVEKSDAFVPFYPFAFVCGCKSDTYIFERAFKKTYIQTKKDLVEVPIEEALRCTIRHEGVHTDQVANGIRLTDQLFVDGTNFLKIHPEAFEDLAESDAYVSTFEKAQALGKKHPQYLFSFVLLWQHALSDSHILTQLNKTRYEQHLLDTQNIRIRRVLDDNLELVGSRLISR